MDSLIAKLYSSSKTVLSSRDLALIWQENDKKRLTAKIAYYVRQKALIRLSRGVFAKNKDYNVRELATSIYSPSYISFETVLREAGLIFQYYDTIFVASKWPKNITIDGNKISFRKLKNSALYNPAGIVSRDNYSIATVERAFLDTIYLFPDYYFDNLLNLDWDKCDQLVAVYDNRELIKRLNKYRKKYAK